MSTDPRDDRIVDFLLGETSEVEAAELAEARDSDPTCALEVAELTDLFERMRTLEADGAGDGSSLRLALRYAVQRRAELRARPTSIWPRLREQGPGWLAAAALLLGAWLGLRVWSDRAPQGESALDSEILASAPAASRPDRGSAAPPTKVSSPWSDDTELPVEDASFVSAYETVRPTGGRFTDRFAGWLEAANLASRMREEAVLRKSPQSRRSTSKIVGGPDVEDRVARLVDDVTARAAAELAVGDADVVETALALRALLAAGGSLDPNAERVIDSCRSALLQRLPELDGGTLAAALAALADLAIQRPDGAVDGAVAEHTTRLARATLEAQRRPLPTGHEAGDAPRSTTTRPELLHWRTGHGLLAAAGRLFRIAPALGVDATLAHRARVLVAAHLVERMDAVADEVAPSLIAAALYGVGDLIDRDAADRQLRFWYPRLLVPDYLALHHVAWSRYPTRVGWAEFQSHLRGLTALPTPARTGDAAALLLCLTVNYAAPGSLDAVLLAGL